MTVKLDVSRRTRLERRRLAFGLGISVVMHLLVLTTFGRMQQRGDVPGATLRTDTDHEEGMRVLDLVSRKADRIEAPTARHESEPHRTASELPRLAIPAADAPGTDDYAGRISVAARLAPRMHDARLWVTRETLLPTGESELATARNSVRSRLEVFNDSLVRAQESAQRTLGALDWTLTDAEGRRWGASHGHLYLGSIPLSSILRRHITIEFAGSKEMRERLREWDLERYQASVADVRGELSKRIKAIRDRQEQLRAKPAGGSR